MLKLFEGTKRMMFWQPCRKEMRRPNYTCSMSKSVKKLLTKETLFLLLFRGTCRMQSWQLLRIFHDKSPKNLFQCLKIFDKNFYLLWKNIKISKKLFVLKKLCWTGKMRNWQTRRNILATQPDIFCSLPVKDCFFFDKTSFTRTILLDT